MMNVPAKIYGVLLVIILLFSCEEFSDGINTNPNNFTDTSESLLVRQAELGMVVLLTGHSARLAGIFADHYTGAELGFVSFENYALVAADFDEIWSSVFVYGYNQALLAREKAVRSENRELEGVAEILMAGFMGETALLFGDIPFAEAGRFDQFPEPAYESQRLVLNAVQELLDEAIDKVGGASVQEFYGYSIYVENAALWSEVAQTLKARYYLAAGNYEDAYAAARLGIQTPDGDWLSRHEDNIGAENLFFRFDVSLFNYIRSENCHLRQLMDGRVPRALTTSGDSLRIGRYFDDTWFNTNPGGYYAADAPGHLATWVETKLIEAEAAVRTGRNGLAPFNEVRDYLAAEYGGAFPQSTASGDDLLYQILEEKYISLPGQLSVFSDLRRTGNLLGVPIKGVGAPDIPQRFLYPQSEINTNPNFPGLEDLFTPTPVNQ